VLQRIQAIKNLKPQKSNGGFALPLLFWFLYPKREFGIAICGVLRTPQMAKNGKNRLAILTIFRFRRTNLK